MFLSWENTFDKWEIKDFLKDLIIIIVIVLLVRTFIGMPFKISGPSMNSSYYDREFIIVDRLSYIFSDPRRWDVVVFKPWVDKRKKYFIKRIIGVPGDIIKLENGDVFLKKANTSDFQLLDEPYLNSENNGFTYVGNKNVWSTEFEVPEGSYFVMWDNRNHSSDSRNCFNRCDISSNYISEWSITGKVFVDLWYFNFKTFSFIHPVTGIETHPRFFSSPATHNYE